MMPMGNRVVEPPVVDLARRIRDDLNEALERQVAGGFHASLEVPGEPLRGLVAVDLEELGAHDVIRLSLDDVARIAAAAALRHF